MPSDGVQAPDPLDVDAHGIPISCAHSPQTDLPVWQYVHKLTTPVANEKNASRPYTHICILCAAAPPLRSTKKRAATWKDALMRQRMSTNAVAHVQRVHPHEFTTIADYKQRKRTAGLATKARVKNSSRNSSTTTATTTTTASTTTTAPPPPPALTSESRGPKLKKSSAKVTRKSGTQQQQQQRLGPKRRRGADRALATPLRRSRNAVASAAPFDSTAAVGERSSDPHAADSAVQWLLSSGLPASALDDRHLLQLVHRPLVGPSALDVAVHVQREFGRFGHWLSSYLLAESRAAMGLSFLALRHELRPLETATVAAAGAVTLTGRPLATQQRAFVSAAIGFIDSQWRKVDLVLAAKVVPRTWDQHVTQLVDQTVSKVYNIPSISEYARFDQVAAAAAAAAAASGAEDAAASGAEDAADVPSGLDVKGEYGSCTDKREDLLTRTLRQCVSDALGVGRCSLSGEETNVCRILRLLQELMQFFEPSERSRALAEIGAACSTGTSLCSLVSMEKMMLSTHTSIGVLARLLATSCARFPLYQSYFQSPVRPTATEPDDESAWTQLTMQDWQTVTEVEAILSHLGQFRLEKRVALRTSAVASSYAMLFRRLLSVTTNASSLKVYCMDEPIINLPSTRRTIQRKAKRVDEFTPTGRQCLLQLRQLISQKFSSPSTPSAVDDEIKAMLLDPRISCKVGDLVTDAQALCRAQEALRQEHRTVFELLAARDGDGFPGPDNEIEDDLDDEFSSLLMVEGSKNQSPAVSSFITLSGRRPSKNDVAEDEVRAWREWQNVCIEGNALAQIGADLFSKGKYNLLKLYHHVDILEWFRDVGQHAHPAASLLARIYLGRQNSPSPALRTSLSRFTVQEEATWALGAAQRAERRCILHHNWRQYQELKSKATPSAANNEMVNPSLSGF
ncbi:unnamed protein product [Hyaloperonospora brassicae]|uniref:Uncharacterized protein n=1 Tax=Hyaloperonospora brassicae TaxID=162125 RepID=A0AAV0UFU7_HYABA|nr:unnamed protein product [Hyaloperonospora brassicae]